MRLHTGKSCLLDPRCRAPIWVLSQVSARNAGGNYPPDRAVQRLLKVQDQPHPARSTLQALMSSYCLLQSNLSLLPSYIWALGLGDTLATTKDTTLWNPIL